MFKVEVQPHFSTLRSPVNSQEPIVGAFFGGPEGRDGEGQARGLLRSGLPQGPVGGFIVVDWRGCPDGGEHVLLLPQRSGAPARLLQPGHLLVDGGLRARFGATSRLGLTGRTENKTKQ